MIGFLSKLLGLITAAAITAVAVQFLAISFGWDPLVSADVTTEATTWIRRRPSEGAAALAGFALMLAAAVIAIEAFASRRGRGHAITLRRREGWTRLDRPSLADSLERAVAAVDRRASVSIRIGPRGGMRMNIATPDPTATGAAGDIRRETESVIERRRLPLRLRRTVATIPRRSSARRRPR